MKRFVVLALAVCGVLAAASPAAAVPPERLTVTQHRVVQDQGQACGFPVRWTIDLTADVTRFFDQDGRLLREQAHIKEDNTLENLTSGKLVREGPDSFTQTTYFDENGVRTHFVVTGLAANAGIVKDVGRVVLVPIGGGQLDIAFSAGKHPVREATTGPIAEALAAFCGVLS
ncbi:hypothetical protein HII36_48455 [Nonomuraea sp. NN258]|uniref:hypothetical protein n=1 Tax=Nonomuraea antri TaxID=2730852 RepID=UPI00156A487A|nr:hypothetical protein [Nonomuraea antri]NRQ39612.1 hypothetical protein [Nonomuraea antri]